jgi:FAD/FMN-containing dehydrogenase
MMPRMMPSRRTFLVGLGRFAVAAELARSLPAAALADEPSKALGTPPSAWKDLAKRLSGNVLRPDDPFFADICRPNNLRYGGNLPDGIARCSTPDHVRTCIDWVKQHGVKFAIRSGGHNYAGFSTTSGLLIDMSKMNEVKVLPGTGGLVKVMGGSVNTLVYKHLERLGRTITHGRCDTVGAAGFLLGGGIGFNMRKFGMGSDLMRATELVTADAQLVMADSVTEPDLLWACCGGGGGNFGINTSFTLQTIPVDKVTVFKLVWKKDLKRVLRLLLTELASAPDEFGSKISVTMPSPGQRAEGGMPEVSILGQLHPSQKELKAIFQSTWELAQEREVKEDVRYWEGQDFLTESTYPYFYQEKSSYMKAANITDEVVAAMFDWAARWPGTSMQTSFKFFQLGGAINRMKPTETAYVHRGFDWLFTIEANWWRPTDSVPQVEASLDWQQKFYADINKRAAAAGAFQNFPDPTLENWPEAYYGENYKKLMKVKKAVDPHMLFKFPQAIKPA